MVSLRNEEAFRRALNHARTWYKRTFMARLIFAWLAIYDLCNAFFLELWPLIELFSCIFQISCATHTSGTTRQPLTTPRPWDNIATGYVATSSTPSNLWFCTWRRSTGESHKRIRLSLSRYTVSSFFFPRSRRVPSKDARSIPNLDIREACWNFSYLEHSILVSKSKYDEYRKFEKDMRFWSLQIYDVIKILH